MIKSGLTFNHEKFRPAKDIGHLYRVCRRVFKDIGFAIDSKGNVKAGGRLYCYSFETGRFYDITG